MAEPKGIVQIILDSLDEDGGVTIERPTGEVVLNESGVTIVAPNKDVIEKAQDLLDKLTPEDWARELQGEWTMDSEFSKRIGATFTIQQGNTTLSGIAVMVELTTDENPQPWLRTEGPKTFTITLHGRLDQLKTLTTEEMEETDDTGMTVGEQAEADHQNQLDELDWVKRLKQREASKYT